MTVPARNARRVVTNDGSVDEIEVLFPAELAVYVKVYAGDPLGVDDMTQLTYGVHYTLSGIGPSTASFIVNITNPLAWDVDLYPRFAVFVDYPVDQPSDVGLGGTFGDRFEQALDRVAWIMQSMNDRQKRALMLPVTQTVDEPNVVALTPNTLFGTDDAGNVTNIDPADFAQLIIGTDVLIALMTMVLNSFPDRPDGDITGLAVGQWYINGGYLSRVQP